MWFHHRRLFPRPMVHHYVSISCHFLVTADRLIDGLCFSIALEIFSCLKGFGKSGDITKNVLFLVLVSLE